MNNAVLLSIIALLGLGLDGSLAQGAVKKMGSTRTIFWRSLLLSVLLGIFMLLNWQHPPVRWLIIGFAIALLGYLPVLAFYKALHSGKLGIVFPIANSSALISLILAAVFLGERLTTVSYMAIGLVIIGNAGLVLDVKSLHQKRLVLNEGTLFALLACIGWGTVFFLYKYPTDALGPRISAFLVDFSVLIAAAIHLLFKRINVTKGLRTQLPRLVSMAVLAAIGLSFYTVALQKGPVSVVNSLVLASGSVGVLYGRLIKKEKLKLTQYIASAMIVAGIVLLGSVS